MKPSILLFVAALSGAAATTATWELDGYQDFLRGRLSGLSITRDGKMTLGPRLLPVYTSDQSQIWSMAQAPDGSLYLGTGNRGRLIKVDTAGKGTVVWTADQPVIFALAIDRAGIVYAATSPSGKIYRIENGRATEYFTANESYIWALAFGPDGALYAGTGQRGKIYRVTGTGQGAVYYETGQAHVTALAFDRQGQLLAGSEPNGILYRITATPGGPARAVVVYDANLPEIRSIIPASDGSIYVGALGGSIARQSAAAAAAATSSGNVTVTSTGTSITVTDAQAGLNQGPHPAQQATATSSLITAPSTSTDVNGVERSALYKISPDSTVETLWSSKDENLYDIALEASGTLLLLTDAQGRLYRLSTGTDGARGATLLGQAEQGDATRLVNSSRGTFIATGSVAKLLRLENTSAPDGWFESPVHDAGAVARWGRLNASPTSNIKFKTRTGNSARPDSTWSEWADAAAAIASPAGRYIQWRADFSMANGVAPTLDRVSLAFVTRNTPPIIRSLSVSAQGVNLLKTSTPANTNAFSITVTDTGETSTAAGTQAQVFPRPAGQQLQISWQADDPEGDRLLYSLYFRGDDERDWKLLRADSSENTFTVDGDSLGDGRYYFRVTASDRLSNPEAQARQSELVSPPVLIDSTPPEVKAGAPRRNAASLEIDVTAEDRASTLKRCEYSIDAKSWQPVEASDGVTDSARETFMLRIANFPAGEHVLVVRVYDAAGNAGLVRVVIP